jgi:hypothetical protein
MVSSEAYFVYVFLLVTLVFGSSWRSALVSDGPVGYSTDNIAGCGWLISGHLNLIRMSFVRGLRITMLIGISVHVSVL